MSYTNGGKNTVCHKVTLLLSTHIQVEIIARRGHGCICLVQVLMLIGCTPA